MGQSFTEAVDAGHQNAAIGYITDQLNFAFAERHLVLWQSSADESWQQLSKYQRINQVVRTLRTAQSYGLKDDRDLVAFVQLSLIVVRGSIFNRTLVKP